MQFIEVHIIFTLLDTLHFILLMPSEKSTVKEIDAERLSKLQVVIK